MSPATFINTLLFRLTMADFKLTISNPKTGKSYKRDITGAQADALLTKDLHEKVVGDTIGFSGYEFEIMGGSDNAGFPMRSGLLGTGRKRIFTYAGVGFSGRDRWEKTQKGLRMKVAVAGQKIGATTTQINLKILKEGAQVFEDAKKEEKKE